MGKLILLMGILFSFNLWADNSGFCMQEAESVFDNYIYDINYHCIDKNQGDWTDKECIENHMNMMKEMDNYYKLCKRSTNG